MLLIRPAAAHRVTVFGSTRNRLATSPGVNSRSRASTGPPRAVRLANYVHAGQGPRQAIRTNVPAFRAEWAVIDDSVSPENHPLLVTPGYGPPPWRLATFRQVICSFVRLHLRVQLCATLVLRWPSRPRSCSPPPRRRLSQPRRP